MATEDSSSGGRGFGTPERTLGALVIGLSMLWGLFAGVPWPSHAEMDRVSARLTKLEMRLSVLEERIAELRVTDASVLAQLAALHALVAGTEVDTSRTPPQWYRRGR